MSKRFRWLKPHIMRHTFASLLAIAGVSIFKIARGPPSVPAKHC
jgi:site-specific recombinase XerD